jgi:hypothetical protein
MQKKRSDIRLSLAIIALAALVGSKGIACINQALSASTAEDGVASVAGRRETDTQTGEAGTRGIKLYARADRAMPILAEPLTLPTIGAASEAVSDVLQVWPLAGAYWVRLAEIRAASGADLASVIAAYRVSVLVAPFDGAMMLDRELLGVQLWEVLSDDDRRSVVTDLTGAWTIRPAASIAQLRQAMALLSPDGRKRLKDGVQARSRLRDAELATIGL